MNAASNILLVGVSPSRPEVLSRTHMAVSSTLTTSLKKGEKSMSEAYKERERTKLPLVDGRQSSNPLFATDEYVVWTDWTDLSVSRP